MSYDNTNTGFIGKNQSKTDEKQPDLKGSINIEGVEYWLSAWKNSKGYGMKFTKKDDQPQQAQSGYRKPSQDGAKARQLPPQRGNDFDDGQDCPF